MPKLSIITINLNNRDGLQKTMASAVVQTFKDYEYLVIDGGSTDGSVDLLKESSNKIDYWVSEADNGIYNAMNKGIAKATGDIVCFLNSGDEYVSISSIETAMTKISDYPKYSWMYIFDYIYSNSLGSKTIISSKDVNNKARIFAKGFGHPSTFYRKEIFNEIGVFDESFRISADREFYMRAILKYKLLFTYFPIPISLFNEGGISTNTKFSELMINEDRLIQRNYFSSFENNLFKNKIFQGINRIIFFQLIFNSLFNWQLQKH